MNRQSEQSVSLSVSDAGIVSKRLYTASRKDWQYFGKDFNIYGGIFIIIGKDQFNPPNNFKKRKYTLNTVLNVDSRNLFKSRLDRFRKHRYLRYDCKTELTGTENLKV